MKPNTYTKAIDYAFPGSTHAEKLGFSKTGCFFISQTVCNVENSGQRCHFIDDRNEGFLTPNDPGLIALFNETEGKPDWKFLRYGNPAALAAIRESKKKATT